SLGRAVDPWFIVAAAPEESRLIRTAREVNDSKPEWVFQKVVAALENLPATAEVSVLGLAFKANIDDLRESPAIEIAAHLSEALADRRINVAEPHVEELPKQLAGRSNVELVSIEESIQRSDVVVVLVDHDDVKEVAPELLAGKVVIDTRGALKL
ncbi:UDP binding domain-containing protein, partial [Paenarthrobacter ureafaciens]|uniref:UDP binding domain-containing protein n=1 Tax=Paenarthrobacter ureafaciens TaxID=37931 RepID=UPI00397A6D16